MKKIICLLAAILLCCLAACSTTSNVNVPIETTIETTEEITTQTTVEKTPEGASAVTSGFTFSTTDLSGNPVSEEIFRDHKLILLNFWEPWCGPCVGEMPDLERIYQEYKDKGLLIVGISFTEDGTADVIRQTGVTYPLLQYTDVFYPLTTDYVPTTVFMTADGQQLTEPTPGARPYEDWVSWIDELLAQ